MLQKLFRYLCGSILRRSMFACFLLTLTLFVVLSRHKRRYEHEAVESAHLWPNPEQNSFERSDAITRFLTSFASQHSNSSTRPTRAMKSIVLVGTFFNGDDEIKNAFNNCPINECKMTRESKNTRYRDFNVIMMVNLKRKKLRNKLLPKPKNQVWISNHWESPMHNGLDTFALGPYINWSSSYRPDSHLMTPYGRFRKLTPTEISARSPSTFVDYAAGRTKKVAWFASNCKDKNGRLNFAKKLREFIEVDIYGQCGTLSCPRDRGTTCFELLKKNYKFYLAFENSNCRYYMTEKLFQNAYSNNVIPIVMGAHPDDYARVLPPHSYIHVDSFESPRDLANYLHLLDKDDRLFNEYFRWKSEWTIAEWAYWCQLCGLLHVADAVNYKHWYPEYTRYWDSNACSSTWKEKEGVRWMSW